MISPRPCKIVLRGPHNATFPRLSYTVGPVDSAGVLAGAAMKHPCDFCIHINNAGGKPSFPPSGINFGVSFFDLSPLQTQRRKETL